MAYSVQGAMACTRLSLEAERQSLGPPDLQLQAMLQWNPEGCCSGQLFAVVVMGGAATPKGVFAALTPRAGAMDYSCGSGQAIEKTCKTLKCPACPVH
eukprot:scaffold2753_cov115-Isochrysis_galbana.AAC.12